MCTIVRYSFERYRHVFNRVISDGCGQQRSAQNVRFQIGKLFRVAVAYLELDDAFSHADDCDVVGPRRPAGRQRQRGVGQRGGGRRGAGGWRALAAQRSQLALHLAGHRACGAHSDGGRR